MGGDLCTVVYTGGVTGLCDYGDRGLSSTADVDISGHTSDSAYIL